MLHLEQLISQKFDLVGAALSIPILLISLLGFLAGIWLWNFEERAYFSALIAQLLQIPVVALGHVAYETVFGIAGIVYFVGGESALHFRYGGSGTLMHATGGFDTVLGLNAWALFVSWLLFTRWRNPALRPRPAL